MRKLEGSDIGSRIVRPSHSIEIFIQPRYDDSDAARRAAAGQVKVDAIQAASPAQAGSLANLGSTQRSFQPDGQLLILK